MTDVILQLNNVESSYGPVKAIRGVSLKVQQGTIVTVLGANGAGKSTILKTISGIIDPQKGSVVYRGEPIQKKDPAWIVRQGIAHVPEGREIFPLLTVRENLLMGAYTRNDKAGIQRDVERMYEVFPRLKERLPQLAGTMSGGERQMLAVGRALMGKPKLLLLDEPSLGLAPLIVREIFRTIASLRETGISVLLVEQNARAALETADYGYVLETGQVTQSGPSKDLIGDPNLIAAYLGGA